MENREFVRRRRLREEAVEDVPMVIDVDIFMTGEVVNGLGKGKSEGEMTGVTDKSMFQKKKKQKEDKWNFKVTLNFPIIK